MSKTIWPSGLDASRRLPAGAVLVAAAMVLVPPISARGAISGTVTALSGSPISGAVVTAAGPGQPPVSDTTGADGGYSLDVAGSGPYGVAVQRRGFAAQSEPGVQNGASQSFALTPATFTPLPVDAGRLNTVIADGGTGVFYGPIDETPDMYLTADFGGSWQAFVMRHDDPDTGLVKSPFGQTVDTSSVPGEIAVATPGVGAGPRIFMFSADFGLTWRRVDTSELASQQLFPRRAVLVWAHASAEAADNTLMWAIQDASDGSWKVARADMSAAAPAFRMESSDPFGAGSVINVADSASRSFVGRVNTSGELGFAPLTSSGPIEFGPPEVSGLPAPPVLLRVGGAEESNAPPDGVLVIGGNGPFTARVLTKAAGAASFAGSSFSAPTEVPAGCEFNPAPAGPGPPPPVDPAAGSIAPTSTGTSGSGSAERCWFKKSGGDPLEFIPSNPPFGDFAYDALWGQSNHVAITEPGGDGAFKFARLENGVPVFPDQPARPGPGEDTGGRSIVGIQSPIVVDTDYGPVYQANGGVRQLAVIARETAVASRDGGDTVTQVARGSSNSSAEWWQGGSGQWLAFGQGGSCDGVIAALFNWDGAASAQTVQDSGCSGLPGLSDAPHTIALEPVLGTDTLFIGVGPPTGKVAEQSAAGNHLYRGRLEPGNPPRLRDVFRFDIDPAGLFSQREMAYCPASSAEPLRDVLFVATGRGLLRVSGATTNDPGVSVVDSIPRDSNHGLLDVRADCATGTVYAGGGAPFIAETGLYKSTDGGQTFTPISIPGTGPGQLQSGVTAIGLNPSDPSDVTAASGQDGGTISNSTDGGQTWVVVHDPTVQRPSLVSDIEFPPTPPGAGASRARLSSSQLATPDLTALVGTDSGVFTGEVAPTEGLFSVTETATSAAARQGARITAFGSDSHPALATHAAGTRFVAFRRANGLYVSSPTQLGWSVPELIPGTTRRDDFPATAIDSAGRLHVAFARTGSKAGVYVTRREANGAWATPRRVSSKAGDGLPAIALVGKRLHVAFLRTKGKAGARGVHHVSGSGTSWSKGAKLPKTGAADARAQLGGPALEALGKRLHLTFARGGRSPGIHYASAQGSKWSSPRRMTKLKGDAEPALALDSKGVPHVVFRRTRGKPGGLVALRIARKSSLRRIAGTSTKDREPDLSASASTLVLVFTRPTVTGAGIYFDRRAASGKWLAQPVRWSADAGDRNPAIGATGQGVMVVFDRR